METIDGKLRLEYWFGAAGPLSAIRRLCRDVAAERPALTFVVARVDHNGSAARSFLISATGGEHYRLPAERREIHVRRANREWAHISPRIALAEAAHAILRETAARWDLRLAGVSSGKRPYRPAADDSDWVFFKYVKDVYAEYGMSVDVGGDDESTADDEVDAALLERAETHWDSRVLRLFNRKSS
jgi:hypothetical protein